MDGDSDQPWPLPHLLSVTGLSSDQRRALLVGVALEVAAAHRQRRLVGPVHLTHVEIEASGRPCLRPAVVPATWTVDDDLRAVLRLARALRCDVGGVDDLDSFAHRLVAVGVEELPVRPRTARWRAHPRWWGRRR